MQIYNIIRKRPIPKCGYFLQKGIKFLEKINEGSLWRSLHYTYKPIVIRSSTGQR
jgi:hypothetical protein